MKTINRITTLASNNVKKFNNVKGNVVITDLSVSYNLCCR